MPHDRDLPEEEQTRAEVAGKPLTASVQDILEEHADAERRADEERRTEEADRERMARRKADEERAVLRHTGGERRLRPRRATRGGNEGAGAEPRIDPRLLVGGALLGVILAGGVRRLVLLGAIAAGAWALYRRVLEPSRDPAVVLQ